MNTVEVSMSTSNICNVQLASGHKRSLEVTDNFPNVCPASEWTMEESGYSLLTSVMSSLQVDTGGVLRSLLTSVMSVQPLSGQWVTLDFHGSHL